jgi:hypothetical protein
MSSTPKRRITVSRTEMKGARTLAELRSRECSSPRHGAFTRQQIPLHLRGNPHIHTVGVLDGVDDSPAIVFVRSDVAAENGRTDGPRIMLVRMMDGDHGGVEAELLGFVDPGAAQAMANVFAEFAAAHAH